jgi:hypothetical protein
MLPRPAACGSRAGLTAAIACASSREPPAASGDWILTSVSSSLKMRSDDAIDAWSTLNFSDMSLIGRKNRCEYRRNATSEPRVSEPSSVQMPPNQINSADASAPMISIAG